VRRAGTPSRERGKGKHWRTLKERGGISLDHRGRNEGRAWYGPSLRKKSFITRSNKAKEGSKVLFIEKGEKKKKGLLLRRLKKRKDLKK